VNNMVVSIRVLALDWPVLVEWHSGLQVPIYGEEVVLEFRPKALHCLIYDQCIDTNRILASNQLLIPGCAQQLLL